MKNLLKNLWSVLTSPFVGLYHLLFGDSEIVSRQDTFNDVLKELKFKVNFSPVLSELKEHRRGQPSCNMKEQYETTLNVTQPNESAVTSDKTMSLVGTLGLFALPAAVAMYNVLSLAADNTGQCPAANHTFIGTF